MTEFDVYFHSALHNRFDAYFHKRNKNYHDFISLSNYVTVKGGKRIPKEKDFSEKETNFLYLRLSDINDFDKIDYTKFKYIDSDVYQILKRYEIVKNDLAISIAGTIGRVIFLKNAPLQKKIILTENCALLALKSKEILPEYLKIILELPLVQEQISMNRIQTTIPKIGLDRISKLQIPRIPSKGIQQKTVDLYNHAAEKKQAKEQEAKTLLKNIDNYLLQELGINLPENAKNKRYFEVKILELLGEQLDVKNIRFKAYKRKSVKYQEILLSEISTINKGKSITKDKIITGHYPVIAGGQTSPYSHSEYNETENVITVSASGAYSGYVWLHDYKIFASDCLVVRSKDEIKYLTQYIYYILKLKQDEIYKMQKGAGQPHVYSYDIANITIPVVTIKKQQEMVEYISSVFTQAKQLQKEANAYLTKTKTEIEKMIVGG